MKRFLPLLISLLLLLAACAPGQVPVSTSVPAIDAPAPLVITDALGRTLSLPAAPQRIVITGKGLFMIADAAYLFPGAPNRIAALGFADQGTGNFISLIDPDYAAKAVLESSAGAEQVAALQPDLVILKSFLAETVGAPIEALGIPVLYVDFETPEQYPRDLAILGQVFQDEARALQVASYYQSRLEAIQQAVSLAESRPRTLLLYYSSTDGNISFSVPPIAWMQTRIVELAGGEPVWTEASLGQGWTQVTLEQIAAWEPEHILIVSYSADPSTVVAGLLADPNWQAFAAVQQGQLHAFPADLYSWDQPDPRWILGLTWLAGRLHPQLFPGLDMIAEAQAFYQQLYGLQPDFFTASILPTLKGDLP